MLAQRHLQKLSHTFQHNIQNCKVCQGGNPLDILIGKYSKVKRKHYIQIMFKHSVTDGVLSVTEVKLIYIYTQNILEVK